MSTQLVQTDARKILEEAGDNYVAAYDQIVSQAERQARTNQIVNRSTRVERFKEAVTKSERFPLAKANKTFKGFIAKVRQNTPLFASEEPRQMTVTEAKDLMELGLAMMEVETDAKAVREEIKRVAFAHMTERFASEGEEFPEHINGSIDVPELGYRFAREGAGRKDPELNEKALRALVGEDVWKRISDVEIIPAQRVEKVSVSKLMAEANINPEVLDHFERSLKVGEWKSPRLNIREI